MARTTQITENKLNIMKIEYTNLINDILSEITEIKPGFNQNTGYEQKYGSLIFFVDDNYNIIFSDNFESPYFCVKWKTEYHINLVNECKNKLENSERYFSYRKKLQLYLMNNTNK